MDHGDSDTPAQPALPRRRRRWLRVLLWSAGITGVLLLIACLWHIAASHAIDSELDRLVAAYRAAGQPVLLGDFDNPPIPDDQNAAKVYLAAATSLTLETEEEKELAWLQTPLTRPKMGLAKTILKRNAEALRLCRQAGTVTAIDWPWRPGFDPDTMRIQTDALSPLRTLGKLMYLAASYHHLRGDDAAAVHTLRDGLDLADAVDHGHTMLDHLVALALQALYLSEIQDILPDLRISSSRRGADAGEIRDLIRYLLDEQAQIRCFQRAQYAERATYIDLAERLDRLYPKTLRWRVQYAVQRPWLRGGMLRVIRTYTAAAQAATSDSYFAALAAVPERDYTWALLEAVFLGEVRGLVQPLEARPLVVIDYRTRAQRRLAATGLAMKLYERDHRHPPSALVDLVGEYLPAVPADPFDPGGGPIRYAPAARWPVLYSLGPDGQDDGGAHGPDLEVWRSDPRQYDIVFFLTDQRPARWDPSAYQAQQEAATSQPAENAPDE